MIGYLQGTIKSKDHSQVLVLAGAVGYLVYMPERLLQGVGAIGDEIELIIHTNVREDAIELYGFSDELDKKIFTHLISVSGIGPKSAIQILGQATAGELIQGIKQEDMKFLTSLPGIGKKTASRLLVELKDVVKKAYGDVAVEENSDASTVSVSGGVFADVIDGLKALGYSEKEVNQILPALQNESGSSQQLFKLALALLSKG